MRTTLLGIRKTAVHAALAALGAGLAANAAATIAPDAGDAHINGTSSSTRNAKYGGANNLLVNANLTTLIRFDLGTVPPGTAGIDVEKATLLLWLNDVSTAGSVEVYAITSDWSEKTVTYNTQPGMGALPIATIAITSPMEAGYVTVDVSNLVRYWLDTPGTGYGVALRAVGTASATFDSKENVGIPPMLDITLLTGGSVGPAGPAGPIGPAGPAGPIGATGTQGPAGATGAQGSAGATGAQGPAGPTGAQGVAGPAGSQGPAGPVGATGPAGAIGAAGPSGTGVLNGVAPPTNADGADGDFYLDTSASALYGPKAAGAWPPGPVSLVGSAGAAGAQGPAGATGATGATGPTGPAGADGAPGATGPQGAPGATGAAGAAGATGPQGSTGAQGPEGPAGPQGVAGATGPQGPVGPSPIYSVAFDINGNPVPFGFHQLLGSYVVSNSEGVVAKVPTFVNVLFQKPGELVNRQLLVITGMSAVNFLTAGCAGDVGYVSGSSIIYTASNGVATLDAPGAVNAPVTLSFWRYDMTTAPATNLQPASQRSSNGTCQNNPPQLTSAIKVDRGAPVTFLNAMWPVTP